LSGLLDRAVPTGSTTPGVLSASERLEKALREIDQAASLLSKRFDLQAVYDRAGPRGPSESDKARVELAKLGVRL
jgi:hypothetical protein